MDISRMTAQGIKSTYIMMEEPMLHHALNYRGTPTNRLGGPTDKCNPDITCAKDPLITGEPRKCPVPLIPRTYGKKTAELCNKHTKAKRERVEYYRDRTLTDKLHVHSEAPLQPAPYTRKESCY